MQSVAVDDYVPAQLRAMGTPPRRSLSSTILGLLTRDLSKVHSHSIPNADVSPQRAGIPCGDHRERGRHSSVLNYSTLAEDLASHGYIVVGFDAPIAPTSSCFLMAE